MPTRYAARLPIDVPTLRVLVAPHIIRGSRFLADTRLQSQQLVAYISAYFPPSPFESFVGVLSLPTSSLHSVASCLSLVFHLFSACPNGVESFHLILLSSSFIGMVRDPPSSPSQPHPKITQASTQTQSPPPYTNNNNVGGSENVHNATAAQHGYMNVNGNGNGVGGGGGYQSQIQSPEGVVVGGVGGLGRMGMGGGYGISVEPLLHTLQGLGVGVRHDPTHTWHRIRNSPTPSPTHQRNAQPTPDAT
ncbi:hypothetical protein M422DRAFT_254553 [Sphaerobolus stellatus SS14]|uniref:Uncharacterized protein n=1 Tax=Sphaerobolus stellatus (strain SS14) TaxID=990650 RepID=A0A0C9V695_SPHS4|nr:hypothetical protein M422DRAFT_254553 [Sphaerobolus stellatus SS14]